ncbi:MAG TPA: PAS domain-containing sensor histidine kinase [Chitinophagales bacterium]|nr:PAS domain-containing sensor histidine kinase [Chitinophagales bacterium]
MTQSNFIYKVISKELHQKDSLLYLLLNKSPHFIGITEPPAPKFIMVNEAGWKMFEMESEQEILSITTPDLFRNPPSDEVINEWRQQAKGKGSFEQVIEMKTRSGKIFWGFQRIDGFNYKDHYLQLISVVDISDMKKIEDNASREKEKFETLFENSTIGIVVVNRQGEIVLMNNFAEIQFGYNKNELIGNKIEKLIPLEFASRHTAHREKFVNEMQNRPMGIGMDLFAARKDGTKFPVEISLSHYTTDQNAFVVAFVNDISVRKKNEESILRQQQILQKYSDEVRSLNQDLEKRVEERTLELKSTLDELEQSQKELSESLEKEKELSDLKSRFVSMASHEFRTPLSTILSSASLIEKYPETDQQEKRVRHIHRIKDNVKNLNDILEDFLSLGKLEEGLIKPKHDPVNIPELIDGVIHDMNEVKKERQKITFTTDSVGELMSDKHLLKNILINLLSNAIKFSKENDAIEIAARMEGDLFILSIKDHGIGMSNEDQQHLFDRFFRGKNAINIKGTGLGLHIVSKYVQLLSGKINCHSELNRGTEFIISLPINSNQ